MSVIAVLCVCTLRAQQAIALSSLKYQLFGDFALKYLVTRIPRGHRWWSTFHQCRRM